MNGTSIARGCVLTLVIVSGTLFGTHAARLRINLSDSMPKGVYWLSDCADHAERPLVPGDMVAVDIEKAGRNSPAFRFFSERRYLSATGAQRDLLFKRVAAQGGDRIELRADRVTVNGRSLSAAASTRLRVARGEAIPRVSLPLTVPPGYVWLSCEHPRGIDSRYFGPVSTVAIRCVAEALWLF